MRALALVLALTFALPATAVLARAPAPTAAEQKAVDKQEAKDRKVVQKALEASSPEQLAAMTPALQAVMDHAPAYWPMVEQRPGLTIMRVNDSNDALAAMLGAVVVADTQAKLDPGTAGKAKPGKATANLNTYGLAAFLLGSQAVEARQPEEAIRWLDKGLALQPDNLMLVTEKGSALTLLRRFSDALALYDAVPAETTLMDVLNPSGRARLQRARGFALIELGRLDEAETAYKASLELEPDHGGAKNELAYIRKLRAGGPKLEAGVLKTEDAKAYVPPN